MRREDLRRWVAARRAADEVPVASAEEMDSTAAETWAQAMSLVAMVGHFVGWPVEPDAVRKREDEAAARAWELLRAAYRVPR